MHDYNHHQRPKSDIHRYEEFLQWLEYQRNNGDIVECTRCHKYIPWDEFVSFEMCDECFDDISEEDVLNGVI